MSLSYVLPILRRPGEGALDELTAYLEWLSERVQLIVVDGSARTLYEEADLLWRAFCRHVPPDPVWSFANGKVNGVHTGIALADHEKVILADDDVRYDATALLAMADALEDHDLVRPQNHFDPLPWHAAWDTSRTLLNRAVGSDSPGTLGVRASVFRAAGGYDGDVMYENLELMRTVEAAGGRIANRPDLHVRRLPPSTRKFFEQRPRQAYDDLTRPAKFALFLMAVPLVPLVTLRRPRLAAVITGAAWASAEVGRRRHGGTKVFPVRTVWWAPIWLMERSVCTWMALGYRVSGGVPYNGSRLKTAAHSKRWLRHRIINSAQAPPSPAGSALSS